MQGGIWRKMGMLAVLCAAGAAASSLLMTRATSYQPNLPGWTDFDRAMTQATCRGMMADLATLDTERSYCSCVASNTEQRFPGGTPMAHEVAEADSLAIMQPCIPIIQDTLGTEASLSEDQIYALQACYERELTPVAIYRRAEGRIQNISNVVDVLLLECRRAHGISPRN